MGLGAIRLRRRDAVSAYFVTRHAGAMEWARRRGIEVTVLDHLDPRTIRRGDIVSGTLPAQIAAEINGRGARYVHLIIDLPGSERGRDLSADDMEEMNARLEEISARSSAPYPQRLRLVGRSYVSLERRWRRWRRWLDRLQQWLAKGLGRVGWTVGMTLLVLIGVPGALGTIVTASWAAGGWAGLIVALAVSAIAYVLAFLVLSVVARTVVWSRLRTVPAREARCRVLVTGLSDLPPDQFALAPDVAAASAGRAADYALPARGCSITRLPSARSLQLGRDVFSPSRTSTAAAHEHP